MRVFLLVFIFLAPLFADINTTDTSLAKKTDERGSYDSVVDGLYKKIIIIDASIKDNLWFSQFSNFLDYQKLILDKDNLNKELGKTRDKDRRDELEKRIKTVGEQLELLKDHKNPPFTKILQAKDIGEYQRVVSPIGIIDGLSYIKNILGYKDNYAQNLQNLSVLISRLQEKEQILNSLTNYNPDDQNITKEISDLRYELSELISARDIAKTTLEVYDKKIDERIKIVRADISIQIRRAMNIAAIIVFVILLSLLFKYIAKKYISDNERFYMANKIINFFNITFIMLILLLAYIENISYFVTVLGFASAGVAIAMKDMFMSMLGWLVITIGGSFHVGDRIRVRKVNGEVYVGDIIDISLLRMTIYEDITYTTWKELRRAGRIIFVPNNYIFTELISNYTHSGMKTVWDGIDILLTFDSNHKKAMYIIKNIARKYSKGYTDIAKKQMNKLRSQYSIKNPNIEPRIFSFFEPYGIKISVWYMTNSYATLSLRSTISSEILEALKKELDIKIAYPAQTLYLNEKDIATSAHTTVKHNEILDFDELNTEEQLF
ncbi:mechanosensitive ion channel domain-containing protein [Campylobacter geochelonis]|uniref:mechanosensitive ion channel domain-containing protein n=1 Tax=Campylobacter geochelonis TaxID=1780362 RepID=UPI0007709D40|nr:mechanosensitive ion channel domain-containing protein [Campylobacter geochelonis]CZE49469.1 mechanosensitive ion channel family protein [Campylobacter geochelonis]